MRNADFARSISLAWELLKRLNLGRTYVCGVSLGIDDVFRDTIFAEESTYEEIFRVGLSRSHYNILLQDYAFFQFSLWAESEWRLGYFPNPRISGVQSAEVERQRWEQLEAAGALTHEEVSSHLEEMPYQGAIPPIRFEYAPTQYRELKHPSAHFHIGRHSENRWPSAIMLNPALFSMIIAKLYYPDAWAQQSCFWGASVSHCMDEHLIRLLSEPLVVHDFSDRERQSFHFGKNMPGSDI